MVDNAPAEPGDSFTHDAQVSRLIKPLATTASGPEPAKHMFVLRGSTRVKQTLDPKNVFNPGRLFGDL